MTTADAAPALPPVRFTVRTAIPPSSPEYADDENFREPEGGGGESLSVIVRVALLVPRAGPPCGFESVRFTVSLPSTTLSSLMGIGNVLSVPSPLLQFSVPVSVV